MTLALTLAVTLAPTLAVSFAFLFQFPDLANIATLAVTLSLSHR